MTSTLSIWYLTAIAIIVAVPLAWAAWVHRSQGTGWRAFWYGAVVFVAMQVIFRIPLLRLLSPRTDADNGLLLHQLAWLAISAGILEESGRYFGYRYLMPGRLDKATGIMYGLGHGVTECMFVALRMAVTLYSFAFLGGLDLSVVDFTPHQLEAIHEARSWWLPTAGVIERMAMLPIHVMLSLTVLKAVATRRMIWLWAAMAIHILINLGLAVTIREIGLLAGELLGVFVALGSVYAIVWRLPSSASASKP